jgi:hypothetical protein
MPSYLQTWLYDCTKWAMWHVRGQKQTATRAGSPDDSDHDHDHDQETRPSFPREFFFERHLKLVPKFKTKLFLA